MFTMQVLNSANEWETVVRKFKSKRTAINYFITRMGGHRVWESVRVF